MKQVGGKALLGTCFMLASRLAYSSAFMMEMTVPPKRQSTARHHIPEDTFLSVAGWT
jgi:hypothetical protein